MERRRAGDFGEHPAPVHLRQVEGEQDEVRPRRGHAGAEHAPPVEMLHQRGAVGHVGQRVAQACGLQRLGRQQAVLGVVVGHDHDRRPRRAARACGHGKLVAAAAQAQRGLVQLAEGHRFHQIGIGAEIVAARDVEARLRGGEDHDRYPPQRRPEVDLPERIQPGHFGHVEVEQDQVRTGRGGGVGELALPPQIVEQLLPVLHEAQLVREPGLLQGLLGQQAILGVVVRHQDQDRPGVGCGAHRLLIGAAGAAGSP